jgi:hypothetical protein
MFEVIMVKSYSDEEGYDVVSKRSAGKKGITWRIGGMTLAASFLMYNRVGLVARHLSKSSASLYPRRTFNTSAVKMGRVEGTESCAGR